MNQSVEGLSLWVLVPIAIVSVIILLWALVDVIRRPQERMRHLPKWAWILIVVFGNTLGQLVYLFVGRETGTPVAETRGPSAATAASAADALYGPTPGERRGDDR